MAVGWLSVTAFTAGLGLLVTRVLVDSSFIRWDERVPKVWEDSRTADWNYWTGWTTALSDTPVVIVIATVIGTILLLARRWASALLLASSLLLEVSAFVVTTILIERDRPDVKQLDASPPTSSFPSGHVAAAVALYATIALIIMWNTQSRTLRTLGWILPAVAVPVVALSRLYRGMHHPADLVGGFILGSCCVLIAYFAVRAWLGESDSTHRHQELRESSA